jgi:hypothetical protein
MPFLGLASACPPKVILRRALRHAEKAVKVPVVDPVGILHFAKSERMAA